MTNATETASTLVAAAERPSFPAHSQLAVVCATFGLCFLLSACVAMCTMHASAYTLVEPVASAALAARLPRCLVSRIHILSSRARQALVLLLGYLLPATLCISWVVALLPSEPDGCFVYGLGVLLVCPAILLAAYAFGLWYHRHFSVSGRIIFCAALALFLPLLLLLLLIVQRPRCPARSSLGQFPHTALTAITMAASMVPVASFVYVSYHRGRPFPLAEELPPAANAFLTALGFRTSSRPVLQKVSLYGATLALLAVYTGAVYYQADASLESEGVYRDAIWSTGQLGPRPTRWAGLYASATIVSIDVMVWLYSRTSVAANTPLTWLTALVACRVAVILIVGEAYIFLVHASMILLLGTLIGGRVTSHVFQTRTSHRFALERLVKLPHVSFFSFHRLWPFSSRIGKLRSANAAAARHGSTAPRQKQHAKLSLPPFSMRGASSLVQTSQSTSYPAVNDDATHGSLTTHSPRLASMAGADTNPSMHSALPMPLSAANPPEQDVPAAPGAAAMLTLASPPPSPSHSPPPGPAAASAPSMTTGSSEVVIEVTRSSEVAPPPPDSSTALNKRVACQPQTSAISVRSGPNEPTQLKSLPTSEVPTARHCLGISLPEAATLLFALVLFVTSLAFAIHADLDPSCADPTISPITCRHPRIAPVEVAHAQWTFVLAAGLIAICLVLCWNVYIRLEYYAWSLKAVRFISLVTELAAAGSGAVLFVVTDSSIIVALSIFLPPTLLLAAHAAHLWYKGRMKLRTGIKSRDRTFAIDLIGVFTSILGCTITVLVSGNPQSALFIGVSGVVLVLSLSGATKFYATLRVRGFVLLTTTATVVLLALVLVAYNLIGSQRVVEVTVAVLAYPTLLVFVTTLFICRASYWEASNMTYGLLALSMLLLLALVLTIIVSTESRTTGFVGLALWVLLLLSALLPLLYSIWSRSNSSRRLGAALGASGVLFIIGALVVGSLVGVGVLLVSACVWIAIGSLGVYALSHRPPVESVRAGLLPVYAYDADQALAVTRHDFALAAFCALVALLGWAVFAAYTEWMTPVTGLAYWAAALLYIYALNAVHGSALDESSLCYDLTPQIVAQAVHLAKHSVNLHAFRESSAEIQVGSLASAANALATLTLESMCDMDSATNYGEPAKRQLSRFFEELGGRLAAALHELSNERDAAAHAMANAAIKLRQTDLLRLHSLDRQRWLLRSFATGLAAQVLLLLRMAAEYSNVLQEDAIGEIMHGSNIDGDTRRRKKAAVRIAAWPHTQTELIKDMLTIAVLRTRDGERSTSGVLPSGRISMWSTYEGASVRQSAAMPAVTELFVDDIFTPEVAFQMLPGVVVHPVLAEYAARAARVNWERAPKLLRRSQADGVAEATLFGSAAALTVAQVCATAEAEGGGSAALVEESFTIALRLVLAHGSGVAARLRNAFGRDLLSANGQYSISLYTPLHRRWESVTIDDTLPCALATGGGGGGAWASRSSLLAPWHARCVNSAELWVALLHKATAKLAGSYVALAAMPVPEIVVCLTGGLVQSLSMIGPSAVSPPTWEQLQLWLRAGCIVLCEPHRSVAASETGRLRAWHVVTSTHETDKVQLMLMESATPPQLATSKAERLRQFLRGASAKAKFTTSGSWHSGFSSVNVAARSTSNMGRSVGEGMGTSAKAMQTWAGAAQGPPIPDAIIQQDRDQMRSSVSDARGNMAYVGLLDLPRACASVYVVRGVGPWRETVLTGSVGSGQPCKFQLQTHTSTANSDTPLLSPVAVDSDVEYSGAGSGPAGVLIAVSRTLAAAEAEASVTLLKPSLQISQRPHACNLGFDVGAIDAADAPSASAGSSSDLPALFDVLAGVPPSSAVLMFADLPRVDPADLDGAVFGLVVQKRNIADDPAESNHPTAPEEATTLDVAAATHYAGPPVTFVVTLHSAQRLIVNAYWTDAERILAARRIEAAFVCKKDRATLRKLRKREYRRQRALAELLDVHERFLGHLDVLANVCSPSGTRHPAREIPSNVHEHAHAERGAALRLA